MSLKMQIYNLRSEGFSYNAIEERLGCSKSTISYHCSKPKAPKVKKVKMHCREKIEKTCTCCGTKFKVTRRAKGLLCKECFYKSFSKNCYIQKDTYKEYLKTKERISSETLLKIKNFILEEQDYKCDICRILNVWNNKELVFVFDHIDGNAANNERSNVRLICSNCDSQLPTFKSKNKNSARRHYRVVKKTELIIGNNNNVADNIGEALTDHADGNTEA